MKPLYIAKYTFKELIKSKVMAISSWASLALLIFVYIASELSYGNPQRISLDFGLGMSSILSVIVAIFLGGNLINKEVESRTIYISLSRPVSRIEFLMGKILGMSLILGLIVSSINVFAIATYLFYGGELRAIIFSAIGLSILEAIIILLTVIFFSLHVNQIISVMNTFVIYTLGHAIPYTFEISFLKEHPLFFFAIKSYSYIFPNLDKLNIKDFLIHSQELESSYILGAFGYGLIYSLFLIFITGFTFSKRELN